MSLPHAPTMGQMKPVHALPSFFFKVHFNIILSTSGYTKWSTSFMFPPYMPQAMPTSSSLIWLSQFKSTNITETPSLSLEFWRKDENWIGHRNVRWFKLSDAAVSMRCFYWIMLPWQPQDIIFIFSHPATHRLSDNSQTALLLWHQRKYTNCYWHWWLNTKWLLAQHGVGDTAPPILYAEYSLPTPSTIHIMVCLLTHWGQGLLNSLNTCSWGLIHVHQLLYCVSLKIYNKFANYFYELKFSGNTHQRP